MFYCAKGHKITPPVVIFGRFPMIVCKECLAAKFAKGG